MKIVTPFAAVAFAAVAACTAAPSEQAGNVQAHDETRVPAAPVACTEATQADALAHALLQPIAPPRLAGGLDLAGDDAWSGIKQTNFESVLCAGTAEGADDAGDGALDYFSWGGDTQPIAAGFSQATGKLEYIQFNPDYDGGVEFKSRDGKHSYSAHVGKPLRKDGKALTLDWTGDVGVVGSEVVDALVATFAPSLPAIEGDCRTSQRCFLRALATEENPIAILGSRDVHFYIAFPTTGGPVEMSTSQYFYMFPEAVGFTPPPPPPTR